MDIFECYEKHVHKDIKPTDTPNSDELFKLEGEDSSEDIKKEPKTEDYEELSKTVDELRSMVEALTKNNEGGEGE